MYEGCSCIASAENAANVFKQLSSSIDLQTKYHRVQGVRDRLVMDFRHGFFRTFCTDCTWRSPSDSLQCDLRKGMENYPSVEESFVVDLL